MKMNYDKMSDFEINKAVSRLIAFGNYIVSDNEDQESVYLCEMDGGWDMLPIGCFDPCNNPSHSWPIIIGNNMTIELCDPNLGDTGTVTIYNPYGRDWQVDFNSNDKALRSAMICFLKMKHEDTNNDDT